ncbi:MAG: protein-L-isoaspartate(D-aspartate) O-methyltransferase [Nitrospinales bacterium]
MKSQHPAQKQFTGQRQKMVEEHLVNRGIKDIKVLVAMNGVPRHFFVQESFHHKAYGDHPLPIGGSQTISQPYIVAAMTEALQLKGHERVLEIGTGSGYQTAVLAELADKVFTIERIKSIARIAKNKLDQLGYVNILYKTFDGTYGWRDQSPYDAILVTAAGPEIPKTLVEQLADGGRIVAPIGDNVTQTLTVLTKIGSQTRTKKLMDCSFVPLIGKYGWSESA